MVKQCCELRVEFFVLRLKAASIFHHRWFKYLNISLSWYSDICECWFLEQILLLYLRNARWLFMFIYTNMCKTFSIAWIPVKAKGHRQRHLRHYLCSQLARAEVLLNYLIIYYYFQSLLSFSKFSVVGSLNLKCELLVS